MTLQPADESPLAVLLGYEQRTRKYAGGLPAQQEIKKTISGIGFRLADMNLFAPLSGLCEVLPVQSVTKVPGAASWMEGIANVRGKLLPIIDFPGMLGMSYTPQPHINRILVLEHADIFCGLIVDQVFGMMQLETDRFRPLIPATVTKSIQAFLAGTWRESERMWLVFSLLALCKANEFKQINQAN
jgi:twitching motility protein PilI